MCVCVFAHMHDYVLMSREPSEKKWQLQVQYMRDRGLTRMHIPSNNSSQKKAKQNLFLTVLFEAKRKLAVVAWIQTSRKINWDLTLSEVWNKLGRDLIPPQSLIEAAYVCHELLSSNIWGFAQPSNSWGLISWELPSSVQESGLSEPPSEDWEASLPLRWVVISLGCKTRFLLLEIHNYLSTLMSWKWQNGWYWLTFTSTVLKYSFEVLYTLASQPFGVNYCTFYSRTFIWQL